MNIPSLGPTAFADWPVPTVKDAARESHVARAKRAQPTPRAPAVDNARVTKETPASNGAGETPTILHGATAQELNDLLNQYDHDKGFAARDQQNTAQFETLQALELTGYPRWVRPFEQTLPKMQTMIAALPDGEREKYQGELAAITIAYENASDANDRTAIEKQLDLFRQAVAAENESTMNDPVLRTEAMFNAPARIGYLGEQGQKETDRLRELQTRFNKATTPDARKDALGQAVELKKDIQGRIYRAAEQLVQDESRAWQQAKDDVRKALQDSTDMTGASAHSAGRLTSFGARVFTDARHAQAFTDMRNEMPNLFAQMGEWEKDLAGKDAQADKAEYGRPFKQVHLPPFESFSDIAAKLPTPNPGYSVNLLEHYQYAQRRMAAAARRIQTEGYLNGNPLRDEFVKDYSPPPSDAEQQADEAFCRLIVGAVPGANLFTNQICPRSNMSESAREGIDIGAGVLGTALGARIPEGEFGLADGAARASGKLPKLGRLLDTLRKPESRRGATESAEQLAARANASNGSGLTVELQNASARLGAAPKWPEQYALQGTRATRTPTQTPGVMSDNGARFITRNGRDYAVRYDEGQKTWCIYDPSNPWNRSRPVARDADGEWSVSGSGDTPIRKTETPSTFEASLQLLGKTRENFVADIPRGPFKEFYRGDTHPLSLPDSYDDMKERLAKIVKHTAGSSGSAGDVQSFTTNRGVARGFANSRGGQVMSVSADQGLFMSAGEILFKYGDKLVNAHLILPGTLRAAIEHFFRDGESEFFWLGKQYKNVPLKRSAQIDALFE